MAFNLKTNPNAYAAGLSAMVMGREDIRTFYERARQWNEGKGSALHLRLHIDAPPALHALHWELLTDPATDSPIGTQDSVLLSRYLSSANWRPVASHPYRTMRAVVAVAAPTDVGKYRTGEVPLAVVDAAAELDRARSALQGYDIIRELGADHPATLANLLSSPQMDVDVLYLVCHGLLTTDVPRLLLVDEDGRADPVDGRLLVERLSELDKCPVIIVLSSCQSAGTEEPDAGGHFLGRRWGAVGTRSTVGRRRRGCGRGHAGQRDRAHRGDFRLQLLFRLRAGCGCRPGHGGCQAPSSTKSGPTGGFPFSSADSGRGRRSTDRPWPTGRTNPGTTWQR